MREETKIIKKFLQENYPNNRFRFKFKSARNYVDSSDCLLVLCDSTLNVEDVINTFKRNTKGISVFKTGSLGIIFDRYTTPKIYIKSIERWVEFDLMEFIEVGIKQ